MTHRGEAARRTGRFRCPAGTRDYHLHVPARPRGRPRGLVVMLHGCEQDPEDFARGTGMNGHAERHGLLVLYPGQPRTGNARRCWNWYRPEHQRRGFGEPAILAGLTREVVREHDVPPSRVFLAGFSAGGAMALVMRETYPEIFAAVGVHSGLATGSAGGGLSALAAMRGHLPDPAPPAGPGTASPVPTLVFHGASDTTVHPANAQRIVSGDEPPPEGALPVGADAGTRLRLVEGGGHAWFGGSEAGSYTEPDGPDASAELMRFFLEQGELERPPGGAGAPAAATAGPARARSSPTA